MLDVERIKSLRESLGMTQGEAAGRAGLNSRQHWNKIESGRAGSITLDTLAAVAKALDVDPADLLIRPKAKPKSRAR